jgi:hypothetical protein
LIVGRNVLFSASLKRAGTSGILLIRFWSSIEQIVRKTGGKPLELLDPVSRAIIHIRHALELDRALMRRAFTGFHVDTEEQEMESLEEKRKKVVNFCKSAFKPKYVEDMKKKFAPVVAEWDEETLDEWIRRGIDGNVAERIFLEIEGITVGDEKTKVLHDSGGFVRGKISFDLAKIRLAPSR